jgi:hypothetical protein
VHLDESAVTKGYFDGKLIYTRWLRKVVDFYVLTVTYPV